MPYTHHGHWYGPGEPTQPGPQLVARCGGPGLCPGCSREAAASPMPEPAPVTVTIDVDTSRYDAAVNSTISAVLRVELEQARGLLERAFTLRENGRPWDPAWQRWDTDTGQFLRSSSNDPAKGAPDGR